MNSPAGRLAYQVLSQDSGKTILRIMQNRMNVSRTMIRELRDNQGIYLNDQPTATNQVVSSGDIITVEWQAPPQQIIPVPLPLSIIYEDEDILVINKPPGMMAHPVDKIRNDTVANAVVHHWQIHNIAASFHPVHRLDRDTSGLMLIAKHKWVHLQIDSGSSHKKLDREYVAVLQGTMSQLSGTINEPIGRLPGSIISRCVTPEGQTAVTHFHVVDHYSAGTVVAVRLETGRTHQIRVHFSHIDHPLFGDTLYGGSDQHISRQALHAARLSFKHPRTGEPLSFTAPIPDDIQQLIERLSAT